MSLWMAWYLQVRGWCGLGGGVHLRLRACLDLCVGGGGGLDPGHGPCGRPAALDPLGQAKHGQSQVVARLPRGDLGQGAGRGFVSRLEDVPETLCGVVGFPTAPGGADSGASMVSVSLMSHCGPGDVAVAATT